MSHSPDNDKSRKLLRWAKCTEDDGKNLPEPAPDNEENLTLTNQNNADEASEKSGSNSSENHETTVAAKCENWYGVKMQRLKESVENLRQELQEKERDNIRLKNKYNVCKRKQEQLQDDLGRYADRKLDTDSELEFLKMQLIDKDKQISKLRGNSVTTKADRKGGKTKPQGDFGSDNDVRAKENSENVKLERDSGIDDDVDCNEISLERSLWDSFFSRKYLNLPKDVRHWIVYGGLAVACCFSVMALVFGSSLLSSIAVGWWALSLYCLWEERKGLHQALKIKHLKKVQELSTESKALRNENGKLEASKNELKTNLTEEIREKKAITSKFMSLSKKLGEERAKNEELAKRVKRTFEELQSERVRRRRAEEKLEEVSAQALIDKENDDVARCGDVCRELRERLKMEREANEKLARENQRLIEEVVNLNLKEEKGKMEKENGQTETQAAKEPNLWGKELVIGEKHSFKKEDNEKAKQITSNDAKIKTMESNIVQPSEPENQAKVQVSVADSSIDRSNEEILVESAVLESNELLSQASTSNVSMNENDGLESSRPCWFCSLNISTEIRCAFAVLLALCLAILFHLVLSYKFCAFICSLGIGVAGVISYCYTTLQNPGP